MSGRTGSPYDLVLLDVDGTLLDSAPGITASLAHAFRALDLPVPPPAELIRFVGPPILESFVQRAGLPLPRARNAVEAYRAHYAEHGARHPVLFPGVTDALDALRAAGLPLVTATSKPEATARRMLEATGIADRFVAIAGASADESRTTKAQVIGWALELARNAGLASVRPVMVGDRYHDVQGAAAHGLPTILAGWGYGGPGEERGAIAVAATPAALVALLAGSPDEF